MYQLLGNQLGLGNQQGSGLGGLLSGCLKSSQNEQRLMAEKSQRNILKKYLTQATGDPIQSALISNTIPGKGYGETLDVGLGTKSSIMQSLGLSANPTQTMLSPLAGLGNTGNTGLLGNVSNIAGLANTANTLGGLTGNNSTLGTLGTLGSLANLGKSSSANTGLFGNNASSGTGVLGSIQNGINTLNTINKVNNAVSGIKNLF